MSWFWRLVLTLYNLALAALGAVMIAAATDNSSVLNSINQWFTNPWDKIWAGAVGGLIFILAVILIIYSLRRETPEAVLVKDGACGQIFITIPAVEQVVLKSTRSFSSVRETRPVITSSRQGLKIYLHVLTAPDTVIPEMTISLQQAVKNDVEMLIGIPVLEVKVLVDDTDNRQRMQGGRL